MSKQIDDQDGSVVYSKPVLGIHWSTHGGPNEYLSTSSLTRTRGAYAKIKFSGSAIGVYGTISPTSIAASDTTSQYIVDGGLPVSYTTNPTKDTQYEVRFFQSPLLSPGEHTLEVVNESEGGWLWLDYFIVATADVTGPLVVTNANGQTTTVSLTTGNSTATSTISGISASGSSSAAAFITSQPSTGNPTTAGSQPRTITRTVDGASAGTSLAPSSIPSSIDSSGATHSSRGPSAGAIVGGILGGFLGLLALIALIWCLRRKLADKFADEAAAIPSNPPLTPSQNGGNFPPPNYVRGSSVVTPFDISGGPSRPNMSQAHNRYGSNASSVYPFVPGPVTQPRYQGPVPSQGQARMSAQQYRPPSRADHPSSGLSYGAVNPPYTQTHHRDISLRYRPSAVINNTSATGGGPSAPLSGQAVYGYPVARPGTMFDSPPAYSGTPPGIVANTGVEKR